MRSVKVLHSEKGTDNRITKRIFAFLSIVALARGHLRYRLEYGKESLVIAEIEEDLHEVLHITQNLSGIPTYKLKFYREMFLPLFNTKTGPDKSADGEEEKIIAITTRQLCDYHKENTGKSISTNNLKETYLNEFINNGLIDEADSILDKRQKIYYPLADFPQQQDEKEEKQENNVSKIKKLSIPERLDNILQHPNLLLPRNCRNIPENWLELEIFDLIKYPVELGKFELYDKNSERLCICRFVKEYDKSGSLSGYFSKPIFCNYYSKLFGSIKYLGHNTGKRMCRIIQPKSNG